MSTDHSFRGILIRTLEIILITAAAMSLLAPLLYAQDAATAVEARTLAIQNPRFTSQTGSEQPIKDWKFESIKLDVHPETASVKVEVTPQGEALVRVPDDGQGIILEGTTETARGDLISAPFDLAPFRLVDVTVEYAFESGDPLLFVCLRPTADRGMVDLDFLPKNAPGTEGRATVRLHSGLFEGEYSLAVSVVGVGSARVCSIEAREAGDYPRPDKPVFVVDLLRDNPRPDGELGWEDAEKFTRLFGFRSVEHAHYTELTPEKLKAADPALIILSPKSRDLKHPDRGKLTTAMNAVMDCDVPMVGICAGHQSLPMVIGKGAFIYRLAEDTPEGRKYLSEWGPTRLEIVKDDPLFQGFPRRPYFYASESHEASVSNEFKGADILASTEFCPTQILKYPDKPWYTFQCHIERDWEFACPESFLFWKNMLRMWKLAP
jgi:GMP synthase-like glutamine amidotransferase